MVTIENSQPYHVLIRVTVCKQPLSMDLFAWFRGWGVRAGGGAGRRKALFPTRPLSTSLAAPRESRIPLRVTWYGTWQIELSDKKPCFLILEQWIKKDTKFWK